MNTATQLIVPWKGLDLPLSAQDLGAGDRRLCLEVGFGNGEYLTEMARRDVSTLWLGMEISQVGIQKAERKAEQAGLDNVRLFHGDAWVMADVGLKNGILDEVYINCPDPWPKKKHAKHRLLQAGFFRVLMRKTNEQGRLIITTDHPEYGDELAEAAVEGGWVNQRPAPGWILEDQVEGAEKGPETKYQRKWRDQGIVIRHYLFAKEAR